MKFFIVLILTLVSCLTSFGEATRTLDGDAIRSTNTTFTRTLPNASGNVMLSSGLVQAVLTGANGSTTVFTLPSTPSVSKSVTVALNGIIQTPTSDYSVSGTALTFTTAPASGQSIVTTYTIH